MAYKLVKFSTSVYKTLVESSFITNLYRSQSIKSTDGTYGDLIFHPWTFEFNTYKYISVKGASYVIGIHVFLFVAMMVIPINISNILKELPCKLGALGRNIKWNRCCSHMQKITRMPTSAWNMALGISSSYACSVSNIIIIYNIECYQ